MDKNIEMLEQRIAELEKQLQNLGAQRSANINPEEMATFKKVSSQLGYDFIDECGINECGGVLRFRGPLNCWGYIRPKPCIVECTCGPCNFWNYRDFSTRGGLEQFNQMG
jgi:hypothetical protein